MSKDSRSREEEGKPRPRHDPPLHNPLETSEQQERPPPVISRGTEGRAINISANYLKLNVDEGKGKKSEESVSVVELTDVLFLFFRCLRVQSHV